MAQLAWYDRPFGALLDTILTLPGMRQRSPILQRSPGKPAIVGGIHQEVGNRGRLEANTVTVEKGETLPPTSKAGHTWTPRVAGAEVFHNPGENAFENGVYRETDAKGALLNNTATVEKGERLPPTSAPGHAWTLVPERH